MILSSSVARVVRIARWRDRGCVRGRVLSTTRIEYSPPIRATFITSIDRQISGVRASFAVNGTPARSLSFLQRSLGFVTQQDILVPTLTVRRRARAVSCSPAAPLVVAPRLALCRVISETVARVASLARRARCRNDARAARAPAPSIPHVRAPHTRASDTQDSRHTRVTLARSPAAWLVGQVRETLTFSAALRLAHDASATARVRSARVEEVISLLDLTKAADHHIAPTGEAGGISGGAAPTDRPTDRPAD